MADNMTFKKDTKWISELYIQSLLNCGLFYTLKHKTTGAVVGHFFTAEAAKGAKTRKTRVTLTRNLKPNEIQIDGKN